MARKAGEVALIPVVLQERRDVLSPVVVSNRRPDALAAANLAEGTCEGLGGRLQPLGACILVSGQEPHPRCVAGAGSEGSSDEM